jgi:elongation factor G
MAAKIDLSRIRNIGIIAHIDAGKTTTTEHVLYYSGAIHRLGGVDEGNTTTDWMEEEQERGITIQSACVPFQWTEPLENRTFTINLIDTPGHVDFTAEVERSLRVLDGCVVVFDAQKGVEAQSETVWRQADKYRVPRLVFVNKMDIVAADFDNAVNEIRERLGGRPVPVTIPIGSGGPTDSPKPFKAIIDLISMEACWFDDSAPGRPDGKVIRREPIPAELQAEAQRWREHLFDVLTEDDPDDKVTSLYLAGEPVPAKAIHELLRKRTLKNEIQPCFCGSGRMHIGIQLMMNGIVWYLPSPLDRPPVKGRHPKKDKEESRKPDPSEPLAALVFKIQADPHGELYYLRVYSGTLKANSRPLNPGKETKEFVTKLYHVHADPTHKDELPETYAGDIVAVIGPKESITGDTLCDPNHPILLESIQFAETVVSQSIEPESSADRATMEKRLTTLAKEDPTFRWHIDPETGQTLISGMGTLHLEIKTNRLREDFKVKVRVGKPRVSYRETLREPITTQGEFSRQAGGAGMFARVTVAFEPWQGTPSINVVNQLDPETVPAELALAAEQGIRGALSSGELGFPLMNVKATIRDAELDEQTSNEAAFTAAGADAVHKALRDNIVLLEPVMSLEVQVPEEYFGAVLGDLIERRASIENVSLRGKLRVIDGRVPLARMFDYAEKIRSLTQGRGTFSMEPHSYEPAPDEVLHALLHPEEM